MRCTCTDTRCNHGTPCTEAWSTILYRAGDLTYQRYAFCGPCALVALAGDTWSVERPDGRTAYRIHYRDRRGLVFAVSTFDAVASTPDEAMAMLERSGVDYLDAEVCNAETGEQVAVYGPRGEVE